MGVSIGDVRFIRRLSRFFCPQARPDPVSHFAPAADESGVAGAPGAPPPPGILMYDPQPEHRTAFPRVDRGTARILRHVSFGHMIRTVCVSAMGAPPSVRTVNIDPKSAGLDARQPGFARQVRAIFSKSEIYVPPS